jgi:hypothetical protein
MEADQEKLEAMDLEANPEWIQSVEEHKEVPNEEVAVEIIGALEDWHGDRRLVVRRREQLKKRTEVDSGYNQKVAAAQGRLTRRAIPALGKGRNHKGLDKTPGNGIRGRSRRQGLRLESKKTLYEALGLTL